MAIVQCIECKKDVSSTAKTCPHCGAKVPKPSKAPAIAIGVVGLFVVLFAMVQAGNSPEIREKADARRGIERCWEEQKRKSLDPGTQRLVAGACETMERKFREQYHVSP